jgi:hypothetical protein
MFKKTTIAMTLAAIATVAVNVQAPAFAAEPSTDLAITETVGLPGLDSFTMTAPTLEDALADYLAGLGPEEDDFGGSAELAALPVGVMDAIMGSVVDLPGAGELPPFTVDDTEPPIDEPTCGEPGGICDERDEGAELPLDPSDTCGEDGVACEFDPTVDDEGMPFDDEEVPAPDHPWDAPMGDDDEASFDDHGWVEPDHDEASDGRSTGTDSGVDTPETATEPATTATGSVVPTAASTDDESTPIGDSVDDDVAEVASILAATVDEGPNDGFGPAEAAMAGIIAMILIAGLGFGALKMGRKGA